MEKIKYYFLWLSGICVGVFFLQFIPGFSDLFILNDRANNGEVWRFATALFLHGSPAHLLFNLFALLFFGFSLERIVGSNRFLQVFLVSGILANFVAVNYYDASLGASGAIYGVIGALTIIRPFMMVWAFGLLLPMFAASLVWIVGDVLRLYGAFGSSNIGSIAHLSGVVVGLLFGLYYLSKGVSRWENNQKVPIRFNEPAFKVWEEKFVKR